jgi:hypothetical protein
MSCGLVIVLPIGSTKWYDDGMTTRRYSYEELVEYRATQLRETLGISDANWIAEGEVMHWHNDTVAGSSKNARRARELVYFFPDLLRRTVSPCECLFQGPLYRVIIHLNDRHGAESFRGLVPWTREQIAQWVDEVTA